MSFIYVPALTTVGQVTRTANGNIAAGSPCVIDPAGTVSQVKITPGGNSVTFPGGWFPLVSGTAFTGIWTTVYHPVEDVVVIFFRDASNLYAVAASVSGAAITYGTPTIIISGTNGFTCACYDSTNNVIVTGTAVSNVLRSVVCTVSGLTLSAGVAGVGLGTISGAQTCVHDPVANVIVFGCAKSSTTDGTAYLGTVSGTTISIGPEVVIYTARTPTRTRLVYDSANNAPVFFVQDGSLNSNQRVYAIVGAIALGVLTVGLPVELVGIEMTGIEATYDPQYGYCVVVARSQENGTAGILRAATGVVSGTSFVWGSVYPSTIATLYGLNLGSTYQTINDKIYLFYLDGPTNPPSDYYGVLLDVNSIGAVTWYTPTLIANIDEVGNNLGPLCCNIGGYDNFNAITLDSPIDRIESIIATNGSSNLTSTNFIGFANGTYISGAPATINTIGSSNTNQTGLTTAGAYYVWRDGTIQLTPDSPSVYAGISDSATSIIVKG